jgi:hypothetical protein
MRTTWSAFEMSVRKRTRLTRGIRERLKQSRKQNIKELAELIRPLIVQHHHPPQACFARGDVWIEELQRRCIQQLAECELLLRVADQRVQQRIGLERKLLRVCSSANTSRTRSRVWVCVCTFGIV